MLNNANKKFLLLIVFIFVTVYLADASVIISQTDGSSSTWFGQSEKYINVGQGQSFYVNQEGWISEIQVYLEPSTGMPDPSDQIICDLRNLNDGEILQSSSIEGFTDEGWKSFSFDKKVTPGNYIFTCYFSRSYTLRSESYSIHGNGNDNSYLQGTRYTSTGGHPEDWNTWKPSVWDLKFKIMILTEIERNTPKTPNQPSGPASGHTGISYTYSTSATDPNGDQIQYIFDWGDGTQGPTDFVNSGLDTSASHSWTDPGNYTIKAMAIDSGYFESELSDGLTITITLPEEDEEILIPTIGVILVFSGLLLTALTTIKKDITIEFGVSQRSFKYVGGAGVLFIIIGVFMLLRHAGLI